MTGKLKDLNNLIAHMEQEGYSNEISDKELTRYIAIHFGFSDYIQVSTKKALVLFGLIRNSGIFGVWKIIKDEEANASSI